MSEISKSKIEEFVAKNPGEMDPDSQYYVKLYETYYITEKKRWFMEWNWAAFILGPIWMAFRGMFWAAVVLILVIQAFDLLSLQLFLISTLFVWVLVGFYGNALYFAHLEYWIKNDVLVKRGVDVPMSLLVFVLFICRITVQLSSQLFGV